MDLRSKNLIIIAKITEETIYFYNYLDHLTTVILTTNSSCAEAEKEFMYLMCDKNCTLIKLNEPETAAKLSNESMFVITTIINNNHFERIMTLSNGDGTLHNQIYEIVQASSPKKHFTYEIGKAVPLCGMRKDLIEMYNNTCKNKYDNLAKAATINTIKQLF